MCHRCHDPSRKLRGTRNVHHAARRRGLTLLELLIAMSIMVLVTGTLGTLAKGVQEGFEYSEGHGLATQHARVVLERIAQSVEEATASEQFPGAIVLAEVNGLWRFPDTLVVWRPDGSPADPEGLPRLNELIVYCPDPKAPNCLLEITVPGDTSIVPPVDNEAAWATIIAAIKASQSSRTVTLTELLRTCTVAEAADADQRAAVRFETRLRPSDDDWVDYRNDNLAWDQLPWAQGIHGTNVGLRQVWVRMELQLIPSHDGSGDSPAAQRGVPFFGSAARYYELHR